MKKFSLIALFVILCCALCALAACGSGDDNSDAPGVVKFPMDYGENLQYSLLTVSDEDCPNGNIDNSRLQRELTLSPDGVYYMVLDMTFSSFADLGDNFTVTTYISSNEMLSATLEDASTGNFEERKEDYYTVVKTTYSTPQDKNSTKSYRIIYRIRMSGGTMFSACFKIDDNAFSEVYSAGNPLNFDLNEDGVSYKVRSVGNTKPSNVQIPAYYGAYPVTEIVSGAFADVGGINSITIPDTVTVVDNPQNTFNRCSSLTSINVSEDNQIYSSQDGLLCSKDKNELLRVPEGKTQVTIPDGVTRIGAGSFYNCTGLRNVDIPDRVYSISSGAFSYCSNLTDINFGDNPQLSSMGSNVFAECAALSSFRVPKGIGIIQSNTFRNCKSLESLTFAEGSTLYMIMENAFLQCESLGGLNFPDSLITIQQTAFSGCYAIDNLDFGSDPHISYIGAGAFSHCTSLTSLVLPDTLKTLDTNAFGDCTNLQTITLPDSLTSFSNMIFENTNIKTATVPGEYIPYIPRENLQAITVTGGRIEGRALRGYENVKDITICDGVEYIGEDAFTGTGYYKTQSNWKSGVLYIDGWLIEAQDTLSGSYRIDDGTQGIADYAFAECHDLGHITLPDSLLHIGNEAFHDCTGLDGIVITSNVITIGRYAFTGCTNLISAEFENTAGWMIADNRDMINETPVTIPQTPAEAAALLTTDLYDRFWRRYEQSL